jgi:putative ATP-dependent endonuclease of the OLD family
MRIANIAIHNFRSIPDASFNLGDYSLLVGANNSGKSNVMDAIRVFYEKVIKYEEGRDKPRFKTKDDEGWIDMEFALTQDEHINLKNEYRQPNKRVKVRKSLYWIA